MVFNHAQPSTSASLSPVSPPDNIFTLPAEVFSSCFAIVSAVMVGRLFLWLALRYRTGYQTVWEIWPSAETPSSVHWRRFYFQLTRAHNTFTYLLTYSAKKVGDTPQCWLIRTVTTEQCVFVLQYSAAAAQSCVSTGVYETSGEVAWFTADLYHLRRLWHRWQPQQRYLHPVSRGGAQLYCCNLCRIKFILYVSLVRAF